MLEILLMPFIAGYPLCAILFFGVQLVPLDQNELFNTNDLDEARELVARLFCSHKLKIISDAESMHLQLNSVTGTQLSINYIHYGATVQIEPGELEDFYLIQIPLRGNAAITNGQYRCNSNSLTGSILNPDRHTDMIWHAGCQQILIYINKNTFKAFVEKFIGRSVRRPIVFETEINFYRPELAKWRRHVIALVSATDAGKLFDGSGALNQQMLEQELLSEFVTHQPSNVQQFANSLMSGPAEIYVKRAQQFIIANAAKPMALEDIAAAVGVPGRTLQYGYQCALNSSPIAALRKERLMQVRHELASGHCNRTIASTATKWGFFHFGRFSQYYRQMFGELPKETLKQANNWRH